MITGLRPFGSTKYYFECDICRQKTLTSARIEFFINYNIVSHESLFAMKICIFCLEAMKRAIDQNKTVFVGNEEVH